MPQKSIEKKQEKKDVMKKPPPTKMPLKATKEAPQVAGADGRHGKPQFKGL